MMNKCYKEEKFLVFQDIVSILKKYPIAQVPSKLLSDGEAEEYAKKNGLIWKKVESNLDGHSAHHFKLK